MPAKLTGTLTLKGHRTHAYQPMNRVILPANFSALRSAICYFNYLQLEWRACFAVNNYCVLMQ